MNTPTHNLRADAYVARLMSELDRAAIARRLQEARKRSGLTQKEMADVLHVHERSIQDWESVSKAAIPFDRLDEWATTTGVTKVWLLQGDEFVEAGVRLARIEGRLEELASGMADLLGEMRQLREGQDEPPQAVASRRRL